ncbi:hypothetical protein LPB137_09840 [Poseidonibacter parvus]|uniref:SGNH hydrolase-type esterase domain-containing protein n=1 Tax=Poseidonibacter parvus TaxID=1850254 RepID=A0A1P8KNH8_9BACT|nr:hypothetical protein [Poseidonibacter parvus]APW66134.1 hypothetical protein LPB137_09840 [Poseidonibacter parvus]
MNSKTWLKKWIILLIFLIVVSFFLIFYLNTYKNVPLRFTNSISFDAKLSFLKNTNKLEDVEIIIIGSSMGLNNINTEILSEKLGDKILNLSSWGLKVNEIFDFMKILDLSNVKKIIYLNQYFDFYGESIKPYNFQDVKNYLYDNSYFIAYFNTFNSLSKNLKDYLGWERRYLNKTKYSDLGFNKYGDIGLKINEENSSQDRWNAITDITKLNNHFDSFEDMLKYLREKNIDFYFVTTPYREIFFSEDKFVSQYNTYQNKIYDLNKVYSFKYINLQKILNLSDVYFADSSHLNFKGSRLVSKKLLKSIIK